MNKTKINYKNKDQTIPDCNQSGDDAIKLGCEAISKIKKF